MPAKDLMFKIAIYDDTKAKLDEIKKNLKDLDDYALGVSRSVLAAVRSIKEIGTGFKLDVPELSTFAEQINKVEKALNRKNAFKVTELKEAMDTIKKFGEQIGGGVIKGNGAMESIEKMASQLEAGAQKMGSASMSSLETYRDQLNLVSKEIETSINNVRTRIASVFESGNSTKKQAADFRTMFGFNGAVTDTAVFDFVKKFEDAISHVQDRLKNYDKSILNNQYIFGDIGKIKQEVEALETTIVAVRNGLSGKSLLGSMPETTSAKIGELSDIIGKVDALEQKLKTFGNGTYPDVMRGFLEAVNRAVSEVENRINGLSGTKIQQGVVRQGTAGAQQLEIKFDENAVLDPLKKAQQTITDIVERIKKDVSGGLKEALNTDLSSAKAIKSLNELTGAISSLEEKMRSLYGVAGRVKDILGDLRGVQEGVSAAASGGNSIVPIIGGAASGVTRGQTEEVKENTKSVKENKSSKEGAAAADTKLAAEERLVADAMSKTSSAAKNQSQILSDLRSMAAQYLSVWGAKQFITDMANITGELELQKKSLEVILGSGTAAAEMYTQLRDLSQQSPYTFEDLLKAHRQLAAFGIEAKNIYGTMKSLTDIGAGLDVPVERLILAYGHTKSYGYLSGIQNRQFETAGIDLVGALSNLYNRRADEAKANGQSAQYRSRKDIFGLMRKREIPFEDVEEVIMDLDKPGGRFYNMQERQYDTLGGKIRNLRNNYRIMMSEIGGANHGLLAGGVDMLNELTGHWEKYVSVIKDVAIGLGAAKVAQFVFGKAAATSNATMIKVLTSARVTSFLNSTNGSWNSLLRDTFNIGSQNDMSARRTKVSANRTSVADIARNKEMNSLTKQRIALTAELSKAQRAFLLASTGVDKAQAMQLARLNPLRRRLLSVAILFRSVAVAVRAFGAAMLSQAAVVAPFMAITALVSHAMEQTRKEKELAKNFQEESNTNRKTAEEILNGYATRGLISLNPSTKYDASGMRIDTNNIAFNKESINSADLESDIEEMKKKLQVLSPIYDGDLLDIDKFESQELQFEALVNKIESIRKANQVQESIAADLANADKRVAGNYAVTRAFGDTFTEDMQDYVESYRNMRSDLQAEFTDRGSKNYTSDADLNAINTLTGGALEALKEGYGLADYREALVVYFRKISQMTDQERYNAIGNLRKVVLTGGNVASDLYEKNAEPWFGKNLDTQYKQMMADAEKWSKALGNDIISQFANDPEGAVAAIMNSVNTFLASAGVTDPAIKQEIIDAVIQSLNNKNNGFNISGNYGGQALNNEGLGSLYAEALTKNQFAQYIKGLSGGMTDEQGKRVFNDAFDKIQAYIKQHNYRFSALGKDGGKKWFKGIYEGAFNSLKANAAWQQRALKQIKTDTELITPVKIKSYVDIYAFAEDVLKKIKEARDRIEKIIPHIKALQVRMGINFDISASTTASQIAKQRKSLEQKLNSNKGVYNVSNDAWRKSSEGQSLLATIKAEEELVNQYKKLETDLSSVKEEKDWLKSEGFKDTDEEKRQKKADAAARKREAADRKYDNDLIKRLQDRQKAIQKAYEWYNRWYELLGNSDAAMNKVRKLVDATDIKGINLDDLKSWETYVRLLERERAAVDKARSSIRIKEDRDRLDPIKSSYTDIIDRGDSDEFSRSQERAASALDRVIDRLGKEYDLFKKIYEVTGDRDLAMTISGRKTRTTGQTRADDVRYAIQDELTNAMRGINLAPYNLPFDKIFNMDDKSIEQEVGKILNIDDEGKVLEENKKLAESYKAIVNGLKKWRDLQEQVNNEGIDTYSSLIKDLKDYDSVVSRNNAERDIRNNSIENASDANGNPLSDSDKKRAKAISDQEALTKNLQASIGYINLINNAIYMGKADFVEQLSKAYEDLNNRFVIGTISASDYAKEMKKLDKISRDYQSKGVFGNDTDFAAFLQGGVPGIQQRLEAELEVRRGEIAETLKSQNPELAKAENQEVLKAEVNKRIVNDEEAKKLKARLEKLGLTMDKMGDMAVVIGAVTGAFDGLQQAATDLANMFDAIGNEKMANFFSDLSDYTGAIGSIFTPIDRLLKNAMSGNVSGVVSSAISAPVSMITAPITAFAKIHDKRRQRSIDKLAEDVSKIEGYTEVISKARERTLGYDYGNVIRGYQGVYTNSAESGAAGRAMARYYGSAGADMDLSGYQQQYNMLLQKREDYIDMYNEEDRKKKKSNSALEEYKQKIAEIDDQIRYFSQDLANSLYGIDIKGWADQIGDALMTAFENGEDAAEAFKDTVTSILQSITKKMLVIGMIEPMMQDLQNELFGFTDDKGERHEGAFNAADPAKSTDKVLAVISKYLGEDGVIAQKIPAIEDILDGAESIVNKNGNNTLLNSNSATMSSSIKGITEQTADLLAAYLNAIRADVSVIRQVQSLFYQNAWPDYIKQVAGGISYLQSIDGNTRAIRDLISENGALFNHVRDLRNDMHRLITHQETIKVG